MNAYVVCSLIGRASDCESEKYGFDPHPSTHVIIVESFNGRNADSDSENVGSIPASTTICAKE